MLDFRNPAHLHLLFGFGVAAVELYDQFHSQIQVIRCIFLREISKFGKVI